MAAIGWACSLVLAVFFSPATRAADGPLLDFESNFTDLVFEMSRSVVTIEASRRVPAKQLGSPGDEALESVVSSGIICDTAGHILASASAVVGKERILVSFENRIASASLLAVDYQTETALLECPLVQGRPACFSDVQVCAGQMVVALGNAYGVRAAPSIGFCAGVRDDGMMQFSVPVTSGAIGGGVFDLTGQLLGLITGGLGQETRVTVALPAYRIPAILQHLLTRGDRESGFIGITSRDIEVQPGVPVRFPHAQASIGNTDDLTIVKRGVLITSIVPLSPANRAGLEVGDLVYVFDGVPVNSAAGFARLVRSAVPGTNVDLHLLRHNEPIALTLTVGRKHLNLLEPDNSPVDPHAVRYRADSLLLVIDSLKDRLQQIEHYLETVD